MEFSLNFEVFRSHLGANLDKATDDCGDLGPFVGPAGQSEFHLAHALNQHHFHPLVKISLHHALMQFSQNIFQGQRIPCFKLDEGIEGHFEVLSGKSAVDLFDGVGGGPSSNLVDFGLWDGIVGQRATFEDVEDFAHIAT